MPAGNQSIRHCLQESHEPVSTNLACRLPGGWRYVLSLTRFELVLWILRFTLGSRVSSSQKLPEERT
ncbi:hypothetical protein WJX82_011669 [Trebouxia sp. C0006]